jgi:hypothetical protein
MLAKKVVTLNFEDRLFLSSALAADAITRKLYHKFLLTYVI